MLSDEAVNSLKKVMKDKADALASTEGVTGIYTACGLDIAVKMIELAEKAEEARSAEPVVEYDGC